MRKILGAAAVAAALVVSSMGAQAADKLVLQLKWVTQAQFAGYYVAKDKGFYRDAGLDVEIRPGGPDINPSQVIAGGGADVVVDWMPSALATREKGVPLVNIAQPFQKSGMELTCRKETGIKAPTDFKGHTLGVWFGGNEYPFLSWMSTLNIPTEGGPNGVTVLKQGFNVDPLLQKQADCISTMTYNEYWQVIDAGIPADQLVVFKYEDQGVATLEDGLYTLEKNLQDPAMVDKLARFVKASMKGWDWAVANPDAAAMIVLDNDATGAQTEKHQKRMMGEIDKLVGTNPKGTGWLDPAAYDRTVQILLSGKVHRSSPRRRKVPGPMTSSTRRRLSGKSAPVITKAPEGAWTHDVFNKAARCRNAPRRWGTGKGAARSSFSWRRSNAIKPHNPTMMRRSIPLGVLTHA